MSNGRRVLLLGATGLVGGELLPLLINDPTVANVSVLTRRPINARLGPLAEKKLSEHIVDFGRLHKELFSVDQIFCALGTTINKAGSRAAFKKVDHGFPLGAARLGRAQGARHFLLVSAIGANHDSMIFYSQVKGQLEKDLREVGFPSVTIARPSVLVGPRKEKRPAEQWIKNFGWLLPAAYRPVDAGAVARALAAAARDEKPGIRIIHNRELRTRSRAG